MIRRNGVGADAGSRSSRRSLGESDAEAQGGPQPPGHSRPRHGVARDPCLEPLHHLPVAPGGSYSVRPSRMSSSSSKGCTPRPLDDREQRVKDLISCHRVVCGRLIELLMRLQASLSATLRGRSPDWKGRHRDDIAPRIDPGTKDLAEFRPQASKPVRRSVTGRETRRRRPLRLTVVETV